MLLRNITCLLLSIAIWSCQPTDKNKENESNTTQVAEENPAANDFNMGGSDEKAIEIADQVMSAMGGRKAWDDTRFISWNFFGSRNLLWDKWTGNVRIEFLKTNLKILVNINDLTGEVLKDDVEMTQTDTLDFYLNRGKSVWINDSYWLVMPFKLKDSGVTLKHLGKDTTEIGANADVLELSFEKVGDTPENLYKVWVNEESSLISQWAFYSDKNTLKPNFITPWADYKKYGNIMLSGDRGKGQLTEIEVLEVVPEEVFMNF